MNSIVCTNKTNDKEAILITVQTFLLHSGKLRFWSPEKEGKQLHGLYLLRQEQ
jgi:hypothetical protein